MQELPQFNRDVAVINYSITNTEDLAGYPKFGCYCCEDTGYIVTKLVKLIIPDYKYTSDKIPVCNRRECQGRNNIGNFYEQQDDRFDEQTCEQLHQIGLADWQNFSQEQKQALEQEINNFAENL